MNNKKTEPTATSRNNKRAVNPTAKTIEQNDFKEVENFSPDDLE